MSAGSATGWLAAWTNCCTCTLIQLICCCKPHLKQRKSRFEGRDRQDVTQPCFLCPLTRRVSGAGAMYRHRFPGSRNDPRISAAGLASAAQTRLDSGRGQGAFMAQAIARHHGPDLLPGTVLRGRRHRAQKLLKVPSLGWFIWKPKGKPPFWGSRF